MLVHKGAIASTSIHLEISAGGREPTEKKKKKKKKKSRSWWLKVGLRVVDINLPLQVASYHEYVGVSKSSGARLVVPIIWTTVCWGSISGVALLWETTM